MPAARKKGSRRGGVDSNGSNQLVWTLPVTEPDASSTGFSFAPNLTPTTFDEPPPTPVEHDMFVAVDDFSYSPRRSNHAKKKPDDHIPRPPNAFILFRSSFIKSQHVSTEVETNHSTLSKIIGLTWQNLPDDERQVWRAKAKQALDEHRRKFPQYAFRPLHARAKGGTEKRKVREVGPKDIKRCAKIAELLVEGKKGQDLDAAIQEFDKHHVPEVVTRFDAPITEETFQKASSSNDNDEESEIVVDTRPSSPSIPRTPSKKRVISRSASRMSMARSESPGPPPLVDRPDSYDDFLDYPSFNIHTFPSTPSNPPNNFFYDPLTSEGDMIFPEFTPAFQAGRGDAMSRPSLSVNTSPCSLSAETQDPDWAASLSSPVVDPNNSFAHFPANVQLQSSPFDLYSSLSDYSTPQLSPSHSLSSSSSYESLASMYNAHAPSDSECVPSTTLYQQFDTINPSAFFSNSGKDSLSTYYVDFDSHGTKFQPTLDFDLAIYGLSGTPSH